jgi:hypothetical protein
MSLGAAQKKTKHSKMAKQEVRHGVITVWNYVLQGEREKHRLPGMFNVVVLTGGQRDLEAVNFDFPEARSTYDAGRLFKPNISNRYVSCFTEIVHLRPSKEQRNPYSALAYGMGKLDAWRASAPPDAMFFVMAVRHWEEEHLCLVFVMTLNQLPIASAVLNNYRAEVAAMEAFREEWMQPGRAQQIRDMWARDASSLAAVARHRDLPELSPDLLRKIGEFL